MDPRTNPPAVELPAVAPPPGAIEAEDPHARKDYRWEAEFPQGYCLEEDLPGMLEKLSPRQLTYVRWRVKGESTRSSARKIGASYETGQKWETAPWWPLAEESARAKQFGDPQAALLPIMPTVIARMQRELSLDDDSENGHATMLWIAERVFGKATQRVETKQEGAANAVQDVVSILKATAGVVANLPRDEQRRLTAGEATEVVEAESRPVEP